MNKIITQIYGITNVDDALICTNAGADHIGLAFGEIKHLGPGQKSSAEAKELFSHVPAHVVKVGLTVAEDVDEIINDLHLFCPDVYHLSGDIDGISPAQVAKIRAAFPNLKIMQAIPVLAGVPIGEQRVLEYIKLYESVTDFFLIDTKAPAAGDIGATGLTHDWNIDRAIIESTSVKCIIAGGLDADNIAEAIRITRPYGVDSCTRTSFDSDGKSWPKKDPVKVKAFIEAARNAQI